MADAWRMLPLAAAVAMASAGAAAGAAAGAMPDANRQAELLHRLRHDCGSCHGMTMKGGLGPALLPATLDGRSAEELAGIVLDGIPRTPMPPWRGEITRDEALWLVGRLKEGVDED